MIKLVMFILLGSLISIQAKVPEPCNNEAKMLKKNKIELDTKTIKGWVRLLKNRSKMGEYGITLSKEEVRDLIDCLNIEMKNRKRVGKMK